MAKKSKKKIHPVVYLAVALNLLPVVAVMAGYLDLHSAMYLYWAECALAAAGAVVMYAKYLIVFFAMSGVMGVIAYLANPYLFEARSLILIFWTMYSLCWLGYVEIGKSPYGQYVRHMPPLYRVGIYVFFMGLATAICFVLTGFFTSGWPPPEENHIFYKIFLCAAILAPTISMAVIRIIDMIGQKHFVDFLLGTYHLPREKQSIVLFLDMVGSSTMAEKLEPRQSMDLIARFIYDCGFFFRINGGDILNYTGDGLVVLWPRHKPNNALSAVQELRAHFASKRTRSRYWKKFGMVPDFRIGLHAGQVVISQIGEEKLFLGLYGDVVNTAARLEQMNKEFGTTVLLSAEVTQGLNQSWRALLKPLGKKDVRGRDEQISVYALYKQ